MQKRALAHVHEKDVRQRAFLHDSLVGQMGAQLSHDDGQQARCRMLHPGSRCGYVFGLVPSVIVFVLPSFFLKEGSIFRK